MENLMKVINFFTPEVLEFDFHGLEPNLPQVKSFYHKCGTLYDEYEFPIRKPNGTLAGRRMKGFTIPFLFGMNEYYGLNESIITPSGVTKPAVLWCGELYSAMKEAFEQSGGQGVFRKMPNEPLSLLTTIFFASLRGSLLRLVCQRIQTFPTCQAGSLHF